MSDTELVRRHIKSDPSRPDDARVIEQGPPVWVVIDHYFAVDGNVCDVAESYGLSDEAVRAAYAFYLRHQAAIDARRAIALARFS